MIVLPTDTYLIVFSRIGENTPGTLPFEN